MKRLGRPFTFILLSFLLLVGFLAIRAWGEKKSLQQNSILVKGTITSSSYDIMNKTDRLQIIYTYSVGGKKFETQTTLEELSKYGNFAEIQFYLRNQHIAVFYDSLHPASNKALLYESEWKEYGMEVTDSLRKAFVIFNNTR